jgi:hypothetical protein
VQREQRIARLGPGLKSAFAGLLALLLLTAVTFSVSHSLHQALHPGGAVNGHFCLVCSIAKGQVGAVDTAVILTALVFSFLIGVRLLTRSPLGFFAYRLSHSRAPPAD